MNTAVVPYVGPQQDEVPAKMEKLRQLSDAIAKAYDAMVEGKSPQCARAWIQLVQQRVTLRATLPPLRVVGGTEADS